MIIANGRIFDRTGNFRQGSIRICDEKIREIAFGNEMSICGDTYAGEEEVVDATGCYVIPGMVDIHLHGCKGYDFCDGTPEAMEAIGRYEAENGVTSIVPATMTLPENEMVHIMEVLGKYRNQSGSDILGINMEGPFVSEAKKGAQRGDYIRKPDVEFYRRMQKLSGGMIKQVAIAPEEDEGFDFIREVSRETVVSVAHTTANYKTAKAAFDMGATHVTHLFNAMSAFGHREPGVVGAAYDSKGVYVELICDGVHIHPAMVRSAFALFGPKRICMISDSMMATGMPDGDYFLGGQTVAVCGEKATLADGTIAGSVCNLYDCLKIAVSEMGIPLEDAVLSCTATPARALGLDEICGRIEKERIADLVLLDCELNIRMVIKSGHILGL